MWSWLLQLGQPRSGNGHNETRKPLGDSESTHTTYNVDMLVYFCVSCSVSVYDYFIRSKALAYIGVVVTVTGVV